jgi:hypothetical protein
MRIFLTIGTAVFGLGTILFLVLALKKLKRLQKNLPKK